MKYNKQGVYNVMLLLQTTREIPMEFPSSKYNDLKRALVFDLRLHGILRKPT